MAVSLTGKLAALTALSMMFGGMLLGAQPAASQALAPEGPQPNAEENLEPCQMWQVTVQFEYTHEGSLKKIQCFSHDKGDYIDYSEYMVPPAGFVISPEWDGSLVVDPNSIGLYPNVIPVVPLSYAVDVSYVFSGDEIDRQSFPNLAPGSVIAEPQLEVPAGYLLAEPFAPHEVTGNATLTVELVRAFYDVTITYTEDGDRVGSQAFTGLSLGTVLTASELTIPAGYELAEPFADHTVSGHADLEVPLIKQETSP
ncbi:hypothetical protein, partial [Leucobacter sp. M11]|uniref:hypothetical protein n=1 Tax=Leucobacter sp. M11 TaxID=2993565 RepID=UPI002D8007B8